MKRSSKFAWLAAGSLMLAAAAAPGSASAENKCRLAKVAELPVTMTGMRGIITLKINGVDAPLELDTGAWYSMITPQAAESFKIRPVSEATVRMVGIGGQAAGGVGIAHEVVFGGIPIKSVQFVIGGSRFDHGSVGLLGQNFLEMFDVEYDLAKGVVRLFRPHDCAGIGLGYWSTEVTNIMAIDPVDQNKPHIIGHVQLNGHKLKVLFDTGAPTTILDSDAADRAGVARTQGTEASGVGSGIGKGLVETWVAPITNLDLGDEQIQKTHLRVGRLGFQDSDMLMGMDFFLSHHLLVSNSQHRIYFTYNGGPVFDIGRAHLKQAAAQATTGDDSKMTASDFSRRAAASVSRADPTAAIADLTRAIALEPDNPRYFSDRAHAYMMAGERDKARADREAALKLKPDDVVALRSQGYDFLHAGDLKQAQASFDAAAKAAPDDPGLRLSFAGAYEAAGRLDLAVREYDRWLAERPNDPLAWHVLNNACWARAEWNHELERALADCDAAVKKGQHNSVVMDSRGMVQLRLGRYAQSIADYNISLQRQSRNAWSYLGRGLAKEKLGDTAGARADIQQALALDGDLPREAHKIGLDSPLLPTGAPSARAPGSS